MSDSTTKAACPPLPGDRSIKDEIASIIRVDQAGEFAAERIYAGQLAVLGDDHRLSPTIRHMAEQEKAHLKTFNDLMVEREVAPTVFSPLWDVASFGLGAVTALMGEKAAMACTAAVEEVIDAHYAEQRERLTALGIEEELSDVIEQFRLEELEHRETALENKAEETPGYGLLTHVIKTGCRVAIELSKRA